jgi:hypothetical protein
VGQEREGGERGVGLRGDGDAGGGGVDRRCWESVVGVPGEYWGCQFGLEGRGWAKTVGGGK